MEKQFGLSDQVISRLAQIVQEGMMLGIDVIDSLRQVRVCEEVTDGVSTGQLVLTEEYRLFVKKMHEQFLAEAERLMEKTTRQSNESEEVDTGEAPEFRLFKE